MDNDEAKFILGSYRPNGADADDPAMAEALRQAALDPVLAREFAAQQAFDERMTRALQGVHAPEAGKTPIIAMRHPAARHRRNGWPIGLAAALALATLLVIRSRHEGTLDLPSSASLPQLAAELRDHHLNLDARNRDAAVLTAWLRDHDAPMPAMIPSALAHLPAIGCEKWTTSRGKVALICFQKNDAGDAVHLFIFADAATAASMPAIDAALVSREGAWTFAQWRDGDCVCVLGVPTGDGDSVDGIKKYLHV